MILQYLLRALNLKNLQETYPEIPQETIPVLIVQIWKELSRTVSPTAILFLTERFGIWGGGYHTPKEISLTLHGDERSSKAISQSTSKSLSVIRQLLLREINKSLEATEEQIENLQEGLRLLSIAYPEMNRGNQFARLVNDLQRFGIVGTDQLCRALNEENPLSPFKLHTKTHNRLTQVLTRGMQGTLALE